MRAAIYHRVSTTDQHSDAATPELRKHAARMGASVVLVVEEAGSGARNDRPGLQRVLRAARAGELDLLLVWKLDRFGRSTLDLISNLRALKAAGVRFVATTQGLDIDPRGDALSQLQFTLLAAVAEFERELISERTKAGLARARRKGIRLGRPLKRPPGEVVRRLRDEGRTWQEVAEEVGCSLLLTSTSNALIAFTPSAL